LKIKNKTIKFNVSEMKKVAIIFIPVIFFLFVNFNTNDEIGAPVKKESQLVGFWKMVPLSKKGINKINPWPLPYQWFYFDADGKIYSMMLSENKEYTTKELKEIFNLLPKTKTPNYLLEQGFVMIDNPEMKGYVEIWGTNIFAKDIEGLAKKGDLIMTLDESNDKSIVTGNVVYYRLLRKLNN
jgi:hypothetical protein